MITALLVLSFLIFFHELGHYLAARLMGVKVETFSIGFGKKFLSMTKNGTVYALSVIPLGGYVQMKGQYDDDPKQKNYDPDSYLSKTPLQRIFILLAGPGFNFLLAFIIYLFIAMTGWTKLAPVVGYVAEDAPAYQILEVNDTILSINGIKVNTWDAIMPVTKESREVTLEVLRDEKKLLFTIPTKVMNYTTIFRETKQKYMIGIAPNGDTVKVVLFPLEALGEALNETWEKSKLIFQSVEKLITGVIATSEISGPVMIMRVTSDVSERGWESLLLLVAVLSVNLGVLNLLPIPALDGGHILFNMYQWITRREINEEIMYKLTLMGWVILGSLMFLGLFNDLSKLFGGGL